MFPGGGDFSCPSSRGSRFCDVRGGHGIYHCCVPYQRPSVIPRYKGLPIWPLAIRSCQPRWLLDCRDAGSVEATMDYVIDIAVPGLTSKSQCARKSMCTSI